GGQTHHKIGQGGKNADGGKEYGAKHIEHQMDHRGTLGVAAGADGGQHGGDTGADVLAKQNEHGSVQTNLTADRSGLQNTRRSRGGLDEGGEEGAHQNTDQRVGEGADHIHEGGPLLQGLHGGAHHLHADEEYAQTGQDVAVVVDLGFLQEHHHGHTHK